MEPYLAEYNERADREAKKSAVPPRRGGIQLEELVEKWIKEIAPMRKYGGARACLSHIRTYIKPQLGELSLQELKALTHQQFVTAVGRRTGRRRTTENVYATLRAILRSGRAWGYASRKSTVRTSNSLPT